MGKSHHIPENPDSMVDNESSKTVIGARLELTRRALGFPTQLAFVAAIGGPLTGPKFSNYVAGRDRLPLDVAVTMCKKWHLTLDWIYRGDMSGLPVRVAQRIEELRAAELTPGKPGRPRKPRR